MQKIISSIFQNCISEKDLLEKTGPILIGFLQKHSSCDAGILVQQEYGRESKCNQRLFFARAIESFGVANGWTNLPNMQSVGTFQQWREFFDPSTEFFFFETEKEMFEWAAKNS